MNEWKNGHIMKSTNNYIDEIATKQGNDMKWNRTE